MKNQNGRYVAVISASRPQNVMKMLEMTGGYATFFVPKGQAIAYQNAGAESVIESGGLCESRNEALRQAGEAVCVQLSDDLKTINTTDGKTKTPVSLSGAIEMILKEMEIHAGFKLGGVAPTSNMFYYHNPISTNSFVVGDFIVVKPNHGLFFDENLKLKEDYDYTLQHLAVFGGVVRVNYILAEFLHRSNGGGAVGVRTHALEQQSIDYLRKKWGDKIKLNPKRQNEILLTKQGRKL